MFSIRSFPMSAIPLKVDIRKQIKDMEWTHTILIGLIKLGPRGTLLPHPKADVRHQHKIFYSAEDKHSTVVKSLFVSSRLYPEISPINAPMTVDLNPALQQPKPSKPYLELHILSYGVFGVRCDL